MVQNWLYVIAMTAMLILGVSVQAEETQEQKLTFGMSTALSGPAAELGLNMREGVLTAFEEANRAGGVKGRRLALVSLDDGYEPARTVPNMHALIDEHEVLAVIGNVGTPTAVAAIPIANAKRVLLYGAYTGAGVLRKTPPDRYVINYRASYAHETAAMVDALVKVAGVDVEQIAFFTQRDAYGDAGYIGGITAMKRHGLKDERKIMHGRYERNTTAVENGLADILSGPSNVRAVIMVGAYEPCAEFIRLARDIDFNPIFMNVSFVGSAPLSRALGEAGNGVVITQVVPHYNADLPITNEYKKALLAYDREAMPSFGSLEGYIAARIMIDALKRIDGEPSREKIIDSLEAMGVFDLGLGINLVLDQTKHQACQKVWPTQIEAGRVVPLQWDSIRVP